MSSNILISTVSYNAFVDTEAPATLLNDLMKFLQVGPEQFLVSQLVTDLTQQGYQLRLEPCQIMYLLGYTTELLLELLLHHTKHSLLTIHP